MRAGKGNLFAGSHCKLPRRGGSAVHRTVDWKQEERILFLNEQCGNVIENKGPLWKRLGQSRNVIDYKGDKIIKREYYRKQRR